MSKLFPVGNLNPSRSDTSRPNVIINFALPGDCPITDPPLTACVDVWDTTNPSGMPSGLLLANRWEHGGYRMLCNKNFLADNGSGMPLTALSFLIETVGTTASNRPPDHLVLVIFP